MPPSPCVTIVTSRLDVGGAERHIARVLPALRRRGIDAMLYVMERGGPLEAELVAQGVRVEGPRRMRFMHWPRATLALARFLRRERPAIVHFFLPRPYLYGSLAAELAGHRRRLMSRRSLTDYRAKYPFLRAAERLLHRRTVGVIGNSQAVLAQLAAEIDDRRKLALIHSGIDLPQPAGSAARRHIRQSLQIGDDALVIAVVANLVAYKGHRDLLDALAMIKDELPQGWTVLAIGRDEGGGAALKERAATLRISDHILWLGERTDVEALLAASDMFVLPSHQEGFSNALLEAMAASLAPIATAVGGNFDAVTNDESGLLVPPRDPRALSGAILRLGRDAELRRRFAAAAHRRIEQHFTLDACVARYEMLYRAMNEPNPRPLAEILGDPSAAIGRGQTTAALAHAD